jgi:hypothetical protein
MISATSPSSMKTIQNIFFCMEAIVRSAAKQPRIRQDCSISRYSCSTIVLLRSTIGHYDSEFPR